MSSFQMEDISCPTFEGTSDYGSRDNSGSEEQTISGFTTIYSNLEGKHKHIIYCGGKELFF